MPIRYQGIANIINVSAQNANTATILDEVALYNLFEGANNSTASVLAANNYLLGWDQYAVMQETANGFTISGVYRATNHELVQGPVPGTFRQVVTRGVSACTVIHLAEGNRHFFLHCNISKTANVMSKMLEFIRLNTNSVQINGSFFNDTKCDDILNTMFNEPNLTAKKVFGRGNCDYNCLIHSEIGVEANRAGGIFFGDYFIVDNVNRGFTSRNFVNEKYCFNSTTNFALFQYN